MVEVRLRTVDAFTDKPFTGNPAAVVMRSLDANFRLRWLTPAVEVELCGHAKLSRLVEIPTRQSRGARRVALTA